MLHVPKHLPYNSGEYAIARAAWPAPPHESASHKPQAMHAISVNSVATG